jgi:hypothetical protein
MCEPVTPLARMKSRIDVERIHSSKWTVGKKDGHLNTGFKRNSPTASDTTKDCLRIPVQVRLSQRCNINERRGTGHRSGHVVGRRNRRGLLRETRPVGIAAVKRYDQDNNSDCWQPATIVYSGDAPTLPTGVFQINAVVPPSSPGAAAVSVGTIGGTVTARQVTVTVAVK